MHTVPEKDIHINLGVYKGKLVEPAEILDDYTKVMEMETGALGVDPELLESEPSQPYESLSTHALPSMI